MEAWKRGNQPALERLIADSFAGGSTYDRLYRVLFTDRNLAMADKIEAMMRTGKTYFVVVGAGHLVGDDGIVSLLDARGYSLQRL